MRSLLKFGCAFSIAVCVGVVAQSALAASWRTEVATSRSGKFAALHARAAQQGEVALIVRFDEIGAPLQTLPPQAQQARMQAIAAMRERLLTELTGWGPLKNVKRFAYTPHVAFSADAPVLRVLEFHPLALEVVEDGLRAPTLGETVPLINADTGAWPYGFTGAGQVIAILDSGVDKTHPFLANKVISEACYSTTNAAYGSTSLCPGGQDTTNVGSGVNCTGISGCDHGTHVAGIAAGKNYAGGPGFSGVAKDAQLVAIQVFSKFNNVTYCGSPSPCILSWDSDQMQALQRVLALRSSPSNLPIASANMSLGGDGYTSNCDGDTLKSSIDNLRTVGTAVAIASGNNGYKNAISAPACISTAISVGSTCDSANGYCSGEDAIASYSNIASFISLLAPGSVVTSSVPGGGFAAWHGTSMATPHVAGAWAVKKQQTPGASVDAILADFRASGVTLDDTRSGGSVTEMKRINFVAPKSYTLTVTNGGNGTVTSAPSGINCGSTCAASFASGLSVTLTAAPASGYLFAGWSGACSGTGSCVVTMTVDRTVSASFSLAPLNNAPTVAITAPANGASYTAPANIVIQASAVDSDSTVSSVQFYNGATLLGTALPSPYELTWTNVAAGSYALTARATDDSGAVTTSSTVNVTVVAPPPAVPAAPSGLTATAASRSRINLAWSDNSANETGFLIERSTNGTSFTQIATVGVNVTTYASTGLKGSKKYYYRVRAKNAAGNSAYSNIASATTPLR